MKLKIINVISFLLICSLCFGNKIERNCVTKLDSLELKIQAKEFEIEEIRDSLQSLTRSFNILLERISDYEDFKGESKGNDQAVWEYGSSIVGIMTAIIILFGIVYYNSSKQAARDAFDDQFENYSSVIKNKITQAQTALDKLDSRVDIIDEVEEDKNNSLKGINDEFNS